VTNTTKKLLLGSLVLAGALTFSVLPAISGGPFDGSGQSGVGGGGVPAVSASTKIYLDHPTDSVYLQYDGGSIGLVGAEVDVPNGFTDSQKVNPDTIITPFSVISQAGSGQRAFGVAQTGARFYFDVGGGNIYCYSDGSQVVCASAWMIPTVSTDTIGSFTANRVIDIFNPHVFPVSSLGTCNGSSSAGSVPEGTIKVQSGSSLSDQSRVCACVSDGAGSPSYTWVNTGCPKTAGTSTTCPACP
jgi:hypothetical protein